LRVRFLADRLPVGGAERVVQSLCLGLPGQGIETALTTFRGLGEIGSEIEAAGIEVEAQLLPEPKSLLALPRLVRHLAGLSCDLLYVLDHGNALFLGRLAARLAGVPHQLCSVHRTRRADGSPSLNLLDRVLMPLSDTVVAVSHRQASYLQEEMGIAPERIAVIHNGIDTHRFAPRPSDEERVALRRELGLPLQNPLLIIVAALRPEKHHELILEALQSSAHEPRAHLAIVGTGARESAIRAHADKLGVSDRLHWLGLRDDVPRILSLADLLVLCSHPVVETFPLCVLEGMAAELPVISTRVGSIEEMVVEGKTGLLVAPSDASALAQAIDELLGEPERAKAMGVAGRGHVLRNFDQETMVEATARLLRRMAAK